MAYAGETLWKPGEDGLCRRNTVEARGGWPMQEKHCGSQGRMAYAGETLEARGGWPMQEKHCGSQGRMAYAGETLWKPGEDGLCSRDTVEARGGWPMQ